MILNLGKKQRKENKWKIKTQNFKTEKNRKQNKWEKTRNVKKGEKMEKNGFVHLHFFCFYFVFSICFVFAFILFYFRFLRGKKSGKKHANGQLHFFFFHFFPFLYFLFFPFFVFGLLFFSVFFFQVLRKNRINYGLADIMLAFRSRPLGRGYI